VSVTQVVTALAAVLLGGTPRAVFLNYSILKPIFLMVSEPVSKKVENFPN